MLVLKPIRVQDSREEFWLIWFPCVIAAVVIAALYFAAKLLSSPLAAIDGNWPGRDEEAPFRESLSESLKYASAIRNTLLPLQS